MTDKKHTILLITDNHNQSYEYASFLRCLDFDAIPCPDINDAFRLLNQRHVTLIIVDVILSGIDGLGIIEYVKNNSPETGVILMADKEFINETSALYKKGAFDYLTKPVLPEDLEFSVKSFISQKKLTQKDKSLSFMFDLFKTCGHISTYYNVGTFHEDILKEITQIIKSDLAFACTISNKKKTKITGSINISKKEAKDLMGLIIKNEKDIFNMLKPNARNIKYLTDLGPKTMLAIPIFGGHKSNGILIIISEHPVSYFISDIPHYLNFLSQQISLSYQNAVKLEQVNELANIDDVTGLYNARYLAIILDKEVNRAVRYGHPVSMLFLDIDLFRDVNNNYGHLVGSTILGEFASILKSCVRSIDILARFGGDEYTIILPNTAAAGAINVAERIRIEIANHKFMAKQNLNIHITVSIGVASVPEHTENHTTLLNIADLAMYKAKDSGKNKVVLADSSVINNNIHSS